MKALLVVLGLALPALSSLRAQAPNSPSPGLPPAGQPEANAPPVPGTGTASHHPPRRERRFERRYGASSFDSLDANRDGKISLQEFVLPQTQAVERQAKATFQERDRNGDGQLTADELSSPAPEAASKPQRVLPRARASAAVPAPAPGAAAAKVQPPASPPAKSAPAPVPTPPALPEGGVVEIAPPPNH